MSLLFLGLARLMFGSILLMFCTTFIALTAVFYACCVHFNFASIWSPSNLQYVPKPPQRRGNPRIDIVWPILGSLEQEPGSKSKIHESCPIVRDKRQDFGDGPPTNHSPHAYIRPQDGVFQNIFHGINEHKVKSLECLINDKSLLPENNPPNNSHEKTEVVLSSSMAKKAMQFYRNNGCLQLKDSTVTSDFTLYRNNVFDNFNRNLPWQGLRKGDEGFQILIIHVYNFFLNFKDVFSYLNGWKDEMRAKKIDSNDFLTITTAQGLRVTIQLTIDLSKYLLEECGFEYVLTGKMYPRCDPLEKFFSVILQSAGPNDHPTTPTFLHLYKMLSIYSVLKPPKHGNCTVTNTDSPKISLNDLHEIFHDKTSERSRKINNLKSRLDTLIEGGIWEPCQVFPSMDSYEKYTSIRDSVVYYVAKLIALKSRGDLVYPNTYLYC
ncbi:hypothetical protein QTP88_029783 [Uroleucon formosanum]